MFNFGFITLGAKMFTLTLPSTFPKELCEFLYIVMFPQRSPFLSVFPVSIFRLNCSKTTEQKTGLKFFRLEKTELS